MIELHHFDPADAEAFSLKAAKYWADEIFLDSIGFEEDKGSFSCHRAGG
jgi:hypothetical protein